VLENGNFRIDDAESAELMKELIDDINKNVGPFNGKTLLVCWEHTEIPVIVQRMGLSAALSDATNEDLQWPADDTHKKVRLRNCRI
jgi:hypothetical protein